MRKHMKTGLTVAFFLSLGISFGADADPRHHDRGHKMGAAADLEWGPIGSIPPGAEMAKVYGDPTKEGPFTMRLRMPADYEIPPHWHPAIENVTVLEGTFHMAPGETFTRDGGMALGAGDFAIMQPETRHYAWTTEATTIQLHGQGPWRINYVREEDDPRIQ